MEFFLQNKLPIFDNDTRDNIEEYEDYNKEYYKSVTVEYIHKYFLNKSISLNTLKYILIKMCREDKIRTFYCGDINDIVFHNWPNWGGNMTNFKKWLIDSCNSYNIKIYKKRKFFKGFNFKI